MALTSNTMPSREHSDDVRARFLIAQDGRPSAAQLSLQTQLRQDIADTAALINAHVEDSREKSLALTHLEEALMWAGKAIFR